MTQLSSPETKTCLLNIRGKIIQKHSLSRSPKKKVLTFLFTENSNNWISVLGISFHTKLFQMKKITNLFAYISSYQNAQEQYSIRQYSNALLFPPKERTVNPVNYMHSTQCHLGSTCVLFIVQKLADRKCQYCF